MITTQNQDSLSTTTTNSSSSSQQAQHSGGQTYTNQQNLTTQERDKLNQLLQVLQQQHTLDASRNQGLQDMLAQYMQQSNLTRDQALADTQGLIQGAMRQLQEGRLAELTRAQMGAGTSGDAMATLLGNDAAARTAEAVGAQRAQTVAEYVKAGGQAQATLANALTALQQDPALQALIQGYGVLTQAGSQTTQTSTQYSNSYSSSSQSSTSTTDGSTKTTTQQYTPYDALAAALGY